MQRHSDWGTPGGIEYWNADTFEEQVPDRKALGIALLVSLPLAGLLMGAALLGPLF